MGKPHRKSIVRESIERLDSLMAIGESRGEAKQEARAAGESLWGFTTGKIHSYQTRAVYQEHSVRFVTWARATSGIRHLAELNERADEQVCLWLRKLMDEGKSPYTLCTVRSALRLFFGDRHLACSVQLPARCRRAITRSRGQKAHDQHFQPANWPVLIGFLQATGLRRREVKCLKAKHVLLPDDPRNTLGVLSVLVEQGKGGKRREVPVLVGYEAHVLALLASHEPDELLFPRIPCHLDVHSYRRGYAQALYLVLAPGFALPPTDRRLKPGELHREAAKAVSRALGHNRIEVVRDHYLR